MKIIITESQLKLIVENEGEDNLLDFTPHYQDFPPEMWDKVYLKIKKSEGIDYDGYYIDGHIDINNSDIKKFDHLVRVRGNLIANGSKIEDLGKLRRVIGNLTLSNTENLKSLGNLEYVGFDLDLSNSKIEDLGHLNEVGRSLDLRFTKNLKSLGKVSQKFASDKFKIYVINNLLVHNTGLSDKQIDRIKTWGRVKKDI